ncbi:hypothetical protein QQS21_000398 [Conoideocrella luteorostrata]|uniref:Trichothecene efflux pump n=1 Tax=Conoideocrella luteorostrata TaxID=1105319 RepID=A0AAJ0D176_9HYPO|nr:hypothetical protein QQS21_000398 [Conoideocrella luteorostrata]
MKRGYLASIYIYTLLIPVSGVSSIVATALVNNTSTTWRSSYFLIIAINVAALTRWVLFYHPPTWDDLAEITMGSAENKTTMLKQIDYVGLFLLSSGLLLFLMGLSWGGSVYPWQSAGVISTMAIGGLLLAVLSSLNSGWIGPDPWYRWNCSKTFQWVAAVGTLSMAASMYYAFNIVFPQQIVTCLFANKIGKIKYQLVVAAAVGASFYGVTLKDQRIIGTGLGVASSLRMVISTSSATIYTAILINRPSTIPATVSGALIQAGLPSASVASFIATVKSNPDQFATIPGVSDRIINIGVEAFKFANAKAQSTVYLSTIAFSDLGVIFSLLTPDMESKLTDSVMTRLKV